MSIENFPAAAPSKHLDLEQQLLADLINDSVHDETELVNIKAEIQQLNQLIAERDRSPLKGAFELFNNFREERQRKTELEERRDRLIELQRIRQRVIDELREKL